MATVEDILMTKGPDVIVVSPNTTVREATRMMAEANCGSVIIKEGDAPAGIFTERDLVRRVVASGKDLDATPLTEVMSAPVASVSLTDSIRHCADTLTDQHIRHLAVVEDGALIGVVSFRDVLTAEMRDSEQRIQQLTQSGQAAWKTD